MPLACSRQKSTRVKKGGCFSPPFSRSSLGKDSP
jgi:hypothetical protein